MTTYNKEYYQKNKKRWKIYKEKKSIPAKETKENNNTRRRNWIANNYEKAILMSTKSRSKRLGIPFNLTLEDIVIPDVCPYLGTPLTRIQHQGKVWTNASIDKINPLLGYTKGNVEIISVLANTMKQRATKEQLLAFSRHVLEVFNESLPTK